MAITSASKPEVVGSIPALGANIKYFRKFVYLLYRRHRLFKSGNFTLHSGEPSSFKIDCDALRSSDIKTLAFLLNEKVGPFCTVVGIPAGGLALAKHLKRYATGDKDHPTLLVDDVYTTGNSMEEWKTVVNATIGGVIFARNPVPDWIVPIFQM